MPEADLLSEEEAEQLAAPPKPRSVADLLKQDFPILDWIVPDVIPDGCHLLVAAPKIGKSLLSLMLAIACARGGKAFGSIRVAARPVLLLDLESGDRRLAKRLTDFGLTSVPSTFEFHTDPDTALAVMRAFMERHKGQSPLVILDTLSEVMGPKPRDLAPMLHEKRTLQPIQKLCADDPGASVLIVHHNRKDKTGDSVDSSSGTHGLTGAVDGIFVMDRPDRQKPEATLIRNSRDVEDARFGMTLKGVVWTFDGRSAGKARLAAQERQVRERVERQGKVGHKMLELLKEHGPLTPPRPTSCTTVTPSCKPSVTRWCACRRVTSHPKTTPGGTRPYIPLSWVSLVSWIATQATQPTQGLCTPRRATGTRRTSSTTRKAGKRHD